MIIPSLAELQAWLGIVLSTPGIGIVLLVLLAYFGLKALYSLFETVEEILIKEERRKQD